MKSRVQKEAMSCSGYTMRLGWYPLLAKNREIPVVALGALLYANSARGNCNISGDTVPTSGWSVPLDHLLPDGIHW